MNNYKILCEIGDNISFNIAGKSHLVDFGDLEKDDNLSRIYRIQFHKTPKSADLEKVLIAITKNPDITLRFYGDYSEDLIDWDKISSIEKLSIDLWHINSLKGVSKLTKLKQLGLSKNVSSKVSLSIIEPLENLEILYTSISKDIEAVGKLKMLQVVSLYQIKHTDLNFLSHLNNLKTLYLSLGSYTSFNGLEKIENLENLSVQQVRGFDDEVCNDIIKKCKNLTALELDNLKHLTKLAFISDLPKLKYLSLEGIKNLDSYEPLSESKSLETLAAYHCQPQDKSLDGLRNLKNIYLGDSYNKSTIESFLNKSAANNIKIRQAAIRGSDKIPSPFIV